MNIDLALELANRFASLVKQYPDIPPNMFCRRDGKAISYIPHFFATNIDNTTNIDIAFFVLDNKTPVFIGDTVYLIDDSKNVFDVVIIEVNTDGNSITSVKARIGYYTEINIKEINKYLTTIKPELKSKLVLYDPITGKESKITSISKVNTDSNKIPLSIDGKNIFWFVSEIEANYLIKFIESTNAKILDNLADNKDIRATIGSTEFAITRKKE